MSTETSTDTATLQRRLQEQGIHTLLVQFTDLNGCAKGKFVPLAHLGTVLGGGAGFAGPSIVGTGLPRTGPRSEFYARGDAATLQPGHGTLQSSGRLDSQLTRRLRDALHRGLAHLQFGQVLLASIGATAPFVGLFGTVWGIYHALASISMAGSITIEKVSGPVGEALIMTAAGLAVAIPAVLAYNVFGKRVAACEADLEGFAHDLREMVLDRQRGGE
jgi:hypothetical protein